MISFDSLRPSPVCSRKSLIAAIGEPPAMSLSISPTIGAGRVERIELVELVERVVGEGEYAGDVCEVAAACRAVVLMDQWSILSFASFRPTFECARNNLMAASRWPEAIIRSISAMTCGDIPAGDAFDVAVGDELITGVGVNVCASGIFGRIPRSAAARIATTAIRPTTIPMSQMISIGSVYGQGEPQPRGFPSVTAYPGSHD